MAPNLPISSTAVRAGSFRTSRTFSASASEISFDHDGSRTSPAKSLRGSMNCLNSFGYDVRRSGTWFAMMTGISASAAERYAARKCAQDYGCPGYTDDVPRGEDLVHDRLQARISSSGGAPAMRLCSWSPTSAVEKPLRHVVFREAVRQVLDDRLLADPRLADQHRIRIDGPRERLHEPLVFRLVPDQKSRLRVAREVGKVDAVPSSVGVGRDVHARFIMRCSTHECLSRRESAEHGGQAREEAAACGSALKMSARSRSPSSILKSEKSRSRRSFPIAGSAEKDRRVG